LLLCDRHPWSTPGAIRAAHLAALQTLPSRERLRRWLRALAAAPALVGASLANTKIQRHYEQGAYLFYPLDDILAILRQLGFIIRRHRSVYAEQCWLVEAIRPNPGGEEDSAP